MPKAKRNIGHEILEGIRKQHAARPLFQFQQLAAGAASVNEVLRGKLQCLSGLVFNALPASHACRKRSRSESVSAAPAVAPPRLCAP